MIEEPVNDICALSELVVIRELRQRFPLQFQSEVYPLISHRYLIDVSSSLQLSCERRSAKCLYKCFGLVKASEVRSKVVIKPDIHKASEMG